MAIYDDITVARQVVEDLVDADFERSTISLVTNDAQNQYGHYLDDDYAPRNDAVTAAEGAGFGAVAGALTGVLVGLAALTLPGIGLLIAAGPVVAGLTGMVAGAVTGGVVSALVKSGVPEDQAPYYAEGIRRGGTLISLETADTLHAEDIMNRYGSINIHERSDVWRQAGWKGFDPETVQLQKTSAAVRAASGMRTTVTTDTTTTRVTHMAQNDPSANIAPPETAYETKGVDISKILPLIAIAHISADPTTTESDTEEIITEELVFLESPVTVSEKDHELATDDFQPVSVKQEQRVQ